MNEIAGSGDQLAIFLRVAPDDAPNDTVYFSQPFRVPEIKKDAGGSVHLDGGFDTGAGRYQVSLLMRDQGGRVCSFQWNDDAVLRYGDEGIKLAIPDDHIEAYDEHLFHPQAPGAGAKDGTPVKLKLIVNFTPREGNFAGVPSTVVDMVGLVSILRNISREPRIGRFSVVAFTMDSARVIFRQNDADQIDFPGLGSAVAALQPGVVPYKQIADPAGGTAFLSNLIESELADKDADAIVFAGPKLMLNEKYPIARVNVQTERPVFYLNYERSPRKNPWPDGISKVVKQLHGAEYTVSSPRDVWTSWMDVMKRILIQRPDNRAETSAR